MAERYWLALLAGYDTDRREVTPRMPFRLEVDLFGYRKQESLPIEINENCLLTGCRIGDNLTGDTLVVPLTSPVKYKPGGILNFNPPTWRDSTILMTLG